MPANLKISPDRSNSRDDQPEGIVICVTQLGPHLDYVQIWAARYLQRASSGLNACWRQKTAPWGIKP